MFLQLFKKKEQIQEPKYSVRLSYDRTRPLTKQNVVNFLRGIGVEVKTNTKARGNNGIYCKNRIDVAKGLKEEQALEVLVHEFAHYIHSKIDPEFNRTGGSLETLFNIADTKEIEQELMQVTEIVDRDKKAGIFIQAKEKISKEISVLQKKIQKDFPMFKRSKKFKEFEKYIKNSDAKYLMKYDIVSIKKGWFIKKEKIYSVKNIEIDFPEMPVAFQSYIKLCSLRRRQGRVSRRINKMNKYFEKPTELFARFVQGYFFKEEEVRVIAPVAVKRFNCLLNEGYYKELKDFFEIFSK